MLAKGKFGCDDGNHVDNDGCNSLCVVETGFTCTGGTATTPDVCTEICGDGLDFGNYACDDGNTRDGDGCSSTCTIETGWTCASGTPNWPDICVETCSAVNRDYGTFACIDANVAAGDGCNAICEVEKGYECTRGSPTSRDTCYEVCGDSWNMGIFECDDGNVNYPNVGSNNDGCNFAIPNNPVTNLASC